MTIQTGIPITVITENLKVPTEFQALKVAVCARVSTTQEEQHNSLETQTTAFTRMIESNPFWEFAGVYSETDSGKTRKTKRGEIYKRERATHQSQKNQENLLTNLFQKALDLDMLLRCIV